MGGGGGGDVVHCSFQSQDAARPFPAQTLSQELEEVDSGKVVWTEICSIKSLCVRVAQVKDVIAAAPQRQLFAGASARHRRVTAGGPVDEDAPKAHGNPLDVECVAPAKADTISASPDESSS